MRTVGEAGFDLGKERLQVLLLTFPLYSPPFEEMREVRRGERAQSREQRAESREQRAESREQRAESREQRAESGSEEQH